QATSLSVRGTANLLNFGSLQNSVLHHHAPVHEYVTHVGGTGTVHDARDQVGLLGLRVRTIKVQYNQIRSLADLDRSDLGFEPQGACAPERRQLEHLRGGKRLGAEPRSEE